MHNSAARCPSIHTSVSKEASLEACRVLRGQAQQRTQQRRGQADPKHLSLKIPKP